MNPIRYPLGSIPGIATAVLCAFVADAALHHHIPLHLFDRGLRIIDDRR